MLLPPTIQEWVADNDVARLVVEAVEAIEESHCHYNWKGTGSAQYPPHMMLALLVYCYSSGIFSSRRIEAATYANVSVRYITADTHPDHDTIASFRRENAILFKACFVRVLELAREMKLVSFGDVAIDGSVIEANASKRRGHKAEELQKELLDLEAKVEELTARAEQIDSQQPSHDGQVLPQRLINAKARQNEFQKALDTLTRKKEAIAAERELERAKFDPSGLGQPPLAITAAVEAGDTINTTDPDARLLPQKKGGFAPSYNVQIAVAADCRAPLILATGVCEQSGDRRQVEPMVEKLVLAAPEVKRVIVDTGYDNSAQIHCVEQRHGINVFCPPEERKSPSAPPRRKSARRQATTNFRQAMRVNLQGEFGSKCQRLRGTTVEPVFSWIKRTLGFTRFHLRGLQKTSLEWDLVCLSFNFALLARHRSLQLS